PEAVRNTEERDDASESCEEDDERAASVAGNSRKEQTQQGRSERQEPSTTPADAETGVIKALDDAVEGCADLTAYLFMVLAGEPVSAGSFDASPQAFRRPQRQTRSHRWLDVDLGVLEAVDEVADRLQPAPDVHSRERDGLHELSHG